MTAIEWRQLSHRWILDAKALLGSKRWGAAYYSAGYAVECGLKACIVVRVAGSPQIVLEDKRFSEKCWTHDLIELVRLADLETARQAAMGQNAALRTNWMLVKDWNERARYSNATNKKAKALYNAITSNSGGVLPWIRSHW